MKRLFQRYFKDFLSDEGTLQFRNISRFINSETINLKVTDASNVNWAHSSEKLECSPLVQPNLCKLRVIHSGRLHRRNFLKDKLNETLFKWRDSPALILRSFLRLDGVYYNFGISVYFIISGAITSKVSQINVPLPCRWQHQYRMYITLGMIHNVDGKGA